MIVGGVWVPTPVEDQGEWVQTEEGREAARLALAAIDERHAATCPRCPLCGQLMNRGDEFGLCSKISPAHVTWRQQVLAREKGNYPSRRRLRPAPAFS